MAIVVEWGDVVKEVPTPTPEGSNVFLITLAVIAFIVILGLWLLSKSKKQDIAPRIEG